MELAPGLSGGKVVLIENVVTVLASQTKIFIKYSPCKSPILLQVLKAST